MRPIALALLLATTTPVIAAERPVIRNEGDLPQARFPISGLASDAFVSDAYLATTVPALKAAAEKLLATSTIENQAIDLRLQTGLAAIDLLQGRPADAERRLLEVRARQTKPQLKAIGNLVYEAIAAAEQAPASGRCNAIAARIAERLTGTDPQIVRDELLLRLSQAETASIGFYAGTLVGIMDETVRAQKSVDLMEGMLMAIYRVQATMVAPCRTAFTGSMRSWVNAPANRPTDIWAAREPAAADFAKATPVVAAVWDTGIDYNLFAGRMAIDPAEPLNGRDDDGNGVVDDVHGPTFDFRMQPEAFPVAPPSSFLAAHLDMWMAFDKGLRDLNYGLDTPEARLFAARGRDASTAEQGEDVDASNENGQRGHGTFVASQIADGMPAVRLYNVRVLPGGYDPKPIRVAEPEAARWVAAMPAAIKRMRGAGVRVVNMSWGETIDSVTYNLLETGAETEPAKARSRAEAIYRSDRAALTTAMASAPDILFVAAAGNNNQTDDTLGAIPQTIPAVNMIVVGATGQSGQPTAFTTFGSGVRIYARGEGNAGRLPGGGNANLSGTSMAAPMVTRAAAQMLAVNPKLTPAQLIEGLTATATDGGQGVKLLHAAAAVAWAKAH